MKNTSFLTRVLLISIVISLASCFKDHEIPTAELELRTLPFQLSGASTLFKIDVKEPGNKPVSEYGIVYTAYFRGTGGHKLDPTIEDNRVIFDTDFTTGILQFMHPKNILDGRTFFYYRAYAILNDGSIVYANRLSFTVEQPQ